MCSSDLGEILQTLDEGNVARIHLGYAGLRHAFTTRNVLTPGRRLEMTLVDGPFSVLDGTWDFTPLGSPADGQAPACKIEFDLRYAFSSRPLESLLSPVFDKVANTFVDSFVKRAEQVYGER